MKVFVTGATGFIGSQVVQELVASGHQVTGLTRSADGAKRLSGLGATSVVGRLDQLDVLRRAAGDSDGVIHTAFIHGLQHLNFAARARLFAGALTRGVVGSFMNMMKTTETSAVQALGSALEFSNRPLVVASGVLSLSPGRASVESDTHTEGRMNREFSESAALAFVDRGVRATAVRLAPTVHGKGDYGFVPQIIKAARKRGLSPYVGDGSNRWPAVHRMDAARLFRLALEKGQAGAKFHGVAESGIPFREIAREIGSRLKVPSRSCTEKEAGKHFGFLSMFVGLDAPSLSEWTRSTLGWEPTHPTLFEDLESADYFTE